LAGDNGAARREHTHSNRTAETSQFLPNTTEADDSHRLAPHEHRLIAARLNRAQRPRLAVENSTLERLCCHKDCAQCVLRDW
jgi:hypothetical protein